MSGCPVTPRRAVEPRFPESICQTGLRRGVRHAGCPMCQAILPMARYGPKWRTPGDFSALAVIRERKPRAERPPRHKTL